MSTCVVCYRCERAFINRFEARAFTQYNTHSCRTVEERKKASKEKWDKWYRRNSERVKAYKVEWRRENAITQQYRQEQYRQQPEVKARMAQYAHDRRKSNPIAAREEVEKRRRQNESLPAERRTQRFSAEEDALILAMREQGFRQIEIAAKIGRTPRAVANRLYKLKRLEGAAE